MGKLKKKPKAKPAAVGEVLTLQAAATYLQVDESGLKADVVAGRVPGGLVAGEWRFSRDALLGWLARPHQTPERKALVAPFGPWTPAAEAEAEAEIADIYARRRELGGYDE